jgi:hypothetical protein
MKVSSLATCALSVFSAGAILSACSSAGFQSAPAGATRVWPDSARSQLLRAETLATKVATNFILRPDRGKSWMSPEVNASSALLYLSDGNSNDVYIYSWPNLTLVGTLTGFNLPQGMCVDKAGNVWIASTLASQIFEYAHGGTTPISTLSDPGEYPLGCWVNPRNGDLAVSNISTTNSGPGSIGIYKGAAGSPAIYSDPNFKRVFFLAYDSDGNLFVDGYNSSQVFQMAKFKRKVFTGITISGAKINFPGGVFTKGLKLSVGDQSGSGGNSIVYQITDTGTVTGTTQLLKTLDCIQYFIYGRRSTQKIISPNAVSPTDDNIYRYPAGGNPIKTINGLSLPIGSAVSP